MKLAKLAVGVAMLAIGLPALAEIDDPAAYLQRGEDGVFELVIDDQGDTITVSENPITSPSFSPDGSQVAFTAALGDGSLGLYAIFVVDVDGTGLVQVTSGSYGELDPAWHPEGEEIFFSLNDTQSYSRTTCCRLAKVDVSTQSVSTITGNNGAIRPSVSPSGDQVVFENATGLYLISSGGGSSTLLVAGGMDPAYSPAGSEIAYIHRTSSTDSLRKVALSSGTVTTLFSTSKTIEAPTWIDGRIYFVEHDGFGYDSRTNVKVRSVSESGGAALTEMTFGGVVAEFDIGQEPDVSKGFRFASGDFNDDRLDDIVYRGPCDSGVGDCWIVHLSNGSAYSEAQDWGNGAYFSPDSDDFGLVAGDFDNDGLDDIAYRGFCGSQVPCWRVQPSTGNGFLYGQNWGNGAYFSPDSDDFGLVAGDFDNDGLDDIAYRGFCGSQVPCWRVQPSTGNGFLYGQNWGNGAYFSPDSDDFGLVAGDFDNDGLDDIAYRGFCGSQVPCWRVQPSTGNGFLYGQNWGNGAYFSPDSDDFGLVAGDFDNDGLDDIAYRGFCGSQVPCWRVQPSTGNGFLYGQNWGNGAYFSPDSDDFGLVAGDFDNDGLDDIAYRGFCGSQVPCWRVQPSTGNGFLYGQNWAD